MNGRENALAADDLAPFAAAVYGQAVANRGALADFAAELRAEGVRVGGLVQEPLYAEDGRRAGIDVVEIDTGRRIPINRPTKENLEHHTCSLNTVALVESTEALRRAVAERVDLIEEAAFGLAS